VATGPIIELASASRSAKKAIRQEYSRQAAPFSSPYRSRSIRYQSTKANRVQRQHHHRNAMARQSPGL
jgi:hypothetical protein